MELSPQINFEEIRYRISIVSLLNRLGYEPVRYSGGEHFYRSMLRDGDHTPSFCVNDKQGVWYDHGLGKGGTIIDLAKDYWSISGAIDAAKKVLECMGEGIIEQRPFIAKQMEMPLKFPTYLIKEDQPLLENKLIQEYISSRGLLEVAADYLRSLHYSIKPEGKQIMNFSAAAWQNDAGGWEVRNASFKGCLGPKGINFYPGEPDSIRVFEGMMDFLSWKQAFKKDQSSILILNSLALLDKAIPKLQDFSFIEIFFDHDSAGIAATQKIISLMPHATDRAYLYQGYNDYNEMHQANLKADAGHPSEKINHQFSKNR